MRVATVGGAALEVWSNMSPGLLLSRRVCVCLALAKIICYMHSREHLT